MATSNRVCHVSWDSSGVQQVYLELPWMCDFNLSPPPLSLSHTHTHAHMHTHTCTRTGQAVRLSSNASLPLAGCPFSLIALVIFIKTTPHHQGGCNLPWISATTIRHPFSNSAALTRSSSDPGIMAPALTVPPAEDGVASGCA